MRWTRRRRARDGMAGRAFGARERSPDVLTSGAEAYVKSCGPDASAVGVKSAKRQVGPTGRGCASYSQVTETTKPDSPGRARYKPSSHCAGNAGVPPLNLYARVRFLSHIFAHETAGAACIRYSLLPLLSRDNDTQSSGKIVPRECGRVSAV